MDGVGSLSEDGVLCVHVIGYKRGYGTSGEYGTSLGINNDNYKMGSKMQIYKIWYKIYKV